MQKKTQTVMQMPMVGNFHKDVAKIDAVLNRHDPNAHHIEKNKHRQITIDGISPEETVTGQYLWGFPGKVLGLEPTLN